MKKIFRRYIVAGRIVGLFMMFVGIFVSDIAFLCGCFVFITTMISECLKTLDEIMLHLKYLDARLHAMDLLYQRAMKDSDDRLREAIKDHIEVIRKTLR